MVRRLLLATLARGALFTPEVYHPLYLADRWSTPSTGRPSPTSRSYALAPYVSCFAFDPWRSSILLVAGDKAGRWNEWYQQAIPVAEQRYETYLKERAEEEGRQA